MTSNCYLVWEDVLLNCVVIDPASEKSVREIDYINLRQLSLDYIILTHEHTDHTWGVNALLEQYPDAKVVCSQACKDNLASAGDMYFQLYYERNDYHYEVAKVDLIVEEFNYLLGWAGKEIKFICTPGHSMGSICIDIDGSLFTGDTVMQTKPFISKRDGKKELYIQSIIKIKSFYKNNTVIYPGHGEIFRLGDIEQL